MAGRTNKQGTWRDVFRDFTLVVILVCAVRWVLVEPFLVPSGSMIPTLLIKDYILVTKFSYGVRVPFMKTWILGPYLPKRGDVVVFRSKEDNFYFLVKRVVGLPGDKILVDHDGHRLTINGKPVELEEMGLRDEDYKIYTESLGKVQHLTQYSENNGYAPEGEYTVPEGQLFMMGDNRDRSSDSRVWGTLPIENLLGKAQFIWMSCDETSPPGSVLCLDEHMRRDRVFSWIF
jgi:signal peptidase I